MWSQTYLVDYQLDPNKVELWHFQTWDGRWSQHFQTLSADSTFQLGMNNTSRKIDNETCRKYIGNGLKMTANIQRQLEYVEPLSRSHNTMLNHLTEANTLNQLKGRIKPKLNHQEKKLNMVLNHSRQKQNIIFECLTTIKAEARHQCLTIHGRSLTSMLNHHG